MPATEATSQGPLNTSKSPGKVPSGHTHCTKAVVQEASMNPATTDAAGSSSPSITVTTKGPAAAAPGTARPTITVIARPLDDLSSTTADSAAGSTAPEWGAAGGTLDAYAPASAAAAVGVGGQFKPATVSRATSSKGVNNAKPTSAAAAEVQAGHNSSTGIPADTAGHGNKVVPFKDFKVKLPPLVQLKDKEGRYSISIEHKEGYLCHIRAEVYFKLPPAEVYKIFTNPGRSVLRANKRFLNIFTWRDSRVDLRRVVGGSG